MFHQGFNLGSNIAEAVNWGLPAWLPFACAAMARDCALSVPGQVPIEKVRHIAHELGGLHLIVRSQRDRKGGSGKGG